LRPLDIEVLWDVLDLVQDGRSLGVVEKPPWVDAKPGDNIRVLDQVIAGAREQVSKQGRLACPTGSGQDERREAAACRGHLSLHCAADVSH
jgi:hypothetical protein